MPVWRIAAVHPRRSRRCTTVPLFFRHFNEWAAVPLRIGCGVGHFSMLLTAVKYMCERAQGPHDKLMARPIALFLVFVCMTTLLVSSLGVFTGRTLRSAAINAFHIAAHLGATGFLLWMWWADVLVEKIFIFFYAFGLVPALVEVLALLSSMRNGID